jgi:hypothetical protein
LILQDFNPPHAVVKKPFSGYNMSYFPHAFFRAGNGRLDSRKFESSEDNFVRRRARSVELWGQLKARPAGRGKLYRKGL